MRCTRHIVLPGWQGAPAAPDGLGGCVLGLGGVRGGPAASRRRKTQPWIAGTGDATCIACRGDRSYAGRVAASRSRFRGCRVVRELNARAPWPEWILDCDGSAFNSSELFGGANARAGAVARPAGASGAFGLRHRGHRPRRLQGGGGSASRRPFPVLAHRLRRSRPPETAFLQPIHHRSGCGRPAGCGADRVHERRRPPGRAHPPAAWRGTEPGRRSSGRSAGWKRGTSGEGARRREVCRQAPAERGGVEARLPLMRCARLHDALESDAGANRRASGGRHAADTVLDAAGAEFLADAAGRPAAFPHGHRCRWRRLRGRNKGFGEQRPHAKLTSQLPWLPVSRSFYTGGKLCLDKFNGPPASRWRLASKYPYRLYRSAAVFACELRVGIYQPVGVEAVGFANASISRNMSKFASSAGFNDFNGLQVRSGRLLPAGKDNLV